MISLRRLRLGALAVLLAAISVQCGGEKTGPSPVPSAIDMAGGDNQVAPINEPLPMPLVVEVTDATGEAVAGVTVEWDAGGAGTVSSATSTTGADGQASVSRTLGETAGQQTTTAKVAGVDGLSATFVATATDGLTPTLAVTTQPSTVGQTGIALAVQPVVQLKDGDGADRAKSGVTITATLSGPDGTLGGDKTQTTNGSGAGTFTDLAITGPDGDYRITFSAPGYTEVLSAIVTLGTPSLSLTAQPTSGVSGVALDPAPAVQLRDGTGAAAPQSGIEITAALVGSAGALGGTTTGTTDAAGAATFDNLIINGPPDDYTLRFTAPGYSAVTSSAITIEAPPLTIALTQNPPTSALNSEVFDPAVQPAVRVEYADGTPAPGVVVTASLASGSGTLQGAKTATTDANGLAQFGDLGIQGAGTKTIRFAVTSDTVVSAPITITALSPLATSGKWGPVVPWDIVPLHLHLLPTGKLLGWGKYEPGGHVMGMPRLWDPSVGPPTSAQMIPVDTMLFCSGHAFMRDGRLMISGGHKADAKGIDITTIFDPSSQTFEQNLPKMAYGRWYPTVTELPNGRMLTMAGRDSAGKVVMTPEIWEGNQWVPLPGAGKLEIPYYPRNFVDPKTGQVFMASERVQSRWFDPDGSTSTGRGKWYTGPFHLYGFNRDYGSAVMYETGKILVVGGGGDPLWATPDPKTNVPTATAEKINLTVLTATWSDAGSMAFPRRHLNATILPDGQVLVTGGTRGGGFVDLNPANGTRAAEIWNPANNKWTTLASSSVVRTYHSVSLLMPDGTVLHGASGNGTVGTTDMPDENSHEIFSPPYLFKGARPTITSAPASVSHDQTFTVVTPNAAQITKVRWIHIGSVTHAFDAGQRANTLTFTTTPTGLQVTTPLQERQATPGYYMLFLLNRNGVPSAGKIIHLE